MTLFLGGESFRHRSETSDVPGRDVTGERRGVKGVGNVMGERAPTVPAVT